MNVKRTSIQTRVISMLLVLCMVLGMVPATALEVFAADTTSYVKYTGTTLEAGTYVIVDEGYALSVGSVGSNKSGKPGAVAVTVSGDKIAFASDDAAAPCLWTVTPGSSTVQFSCAYNNTTYYIRNDSSYITSKTGEPIDLTVDATDGANGNYKIDVGNSQYIYYTSSGFSRDGSGSVNLYKLTTDPDSGSDGDGDSGNTGSSSDYIYDFTVEGDADGNSFYTFAGSSYMSNPGDHGTYDSYTKALKFDSSGKATFATVGAGKLIVKVASKTAGATVQLTPKNGEAVVQTITNKETLYTFEFDVAANTEYTYSRKSSESALYYIEYVPNSPSGHTHSLSQVAAVSATCANAGNSAYYTCSGCDKWFSDANGNTEITNKDSVVIPATGNHNYVITTHPASCTAQGYTEHTCSVCGDTYNDTYTSMLSHIYVNGECSVCGAADPNYSAGIALTNWWSDFYGNYQITETAKTWSFTATTAASASAFWDTIGAVFFHSSNGARDGSDLLDELAVRGDSFAVSQEFPVWESAGQHAIGGKQYPADWDTWVQQNHNGASVSITAQLVNNSKNLAVSITVNGVTNVYSVPVDSSNTSPIYMSLTGANVTITEPVETTGASFTDSKVLNHTNVYEETADTATCVAAGKKTFTCSCGDSYEEDSAATGEHTYDEDGECTVCGEKEASNDSATGTATVGSASGDGYVYELYTGEAIDSNASYVIVYKDSASATSGTALMVRGTNSKASTAQAVTINGTKAVFSENADNCLWTINGTYLSIYSNAEKKTYYLNPDASQNDSGTVNAVTLVNAETGCWQIDLKSGQELYYSASESKWKRDETSTEYYVYLYKAVPATSRTTYNVTLTADQASLALQVGGSNGTVSGTVTAVNAETGETGYVNGKTILWDSDNKGVVTVASNGTVTVVGEGTAIITGTLAGVTIGGTAASSVSSDITIQIPVTVTAAQLYDDQWTTEETDKVTLNNSGSVTFTLSGTVPANAWGHIDNVKLYKEGSNTPVWTEDFDDYSTVGWALTALNHISANADWTNNKTGKLDLWLNADNATTASASYTVSGLEEGTYYFTYDIIGNSTLTGAATAAEDEVKEVTYAPASSVVSGSYIISGNALGGRTMWHEALSEGDNGAYLTEKSSGVYETDTAVELWTIDASTGYISYTDGSTTTYLIDSGGSLKLSTDSSKATKWTFTAVDAAKGTYQVKGTSGKYLQVQSSCVAKLSSSTTTVYLYQASGVATTQKTITGSTLNMTNVTVDNGATTVPEGKLSGLTMTVTYSDGSKEVISKDKLTIDYTIEETSSGKKIDIAYKDANGTVLAQNSLTVIESAASSGTTTAWNHNFTDDGFTGTEGYYSFTGDQVTNGKYGTYSQGGETLNYALKFDSKGEITFTTPNEADGYVLTLYAATASTSGAALNISGGEMDLDLSMTSANTLNTFTVDLKPDTTYTIQQDGNNESGIFFLDLVATGEGSGLVTKYVLDTDGLDTGKGYIIVAQDSDGKYYALSHDGTSEKAVEVTLSSDGKIVNISDTDATNALWSFATTDDGYFASNKGEDTTIYLKTGSATVVDDSRYSNITVTHNGSGMYVINMGGKDLVVVGGDFQRGSADLTNVVGLYYKSSVSANSASVSNVPTLQVGTYPTHTMVPTVIFGGQTTTNYSISWNSGNTNVATVDPAGEITAVAEGEATMTGTVTFSDGTTTTISVPVTVTVPTIDLGEDITMYVGDEGYYFNPDVYIHSEVDEYTLDWTISGGENVVSVKNGTVKALANGTVTLTATLATVTVDGDTTNVSSYRYSDSVYITVNTDYIAAGRLNTTTLTVETDDEGNASGEDIQAALNTVALNLTWASGKAETIEAKDLAFTDNGDGTYTVTYTEGEYTFTGTVTVQLLSKEAASADGVINVGDSEYVLDTDGVDAGEEYLIVWKDGSNYYALVNPDEDDSGSKGSAQKVTVSGDKATISTDYADLAEWTFNNKTTSGDHEGFKIYNTERYFRVNNNNFLSGASNATVIYVYHEGDGEYRIALTVDTNADVDDDLSTRDLIYDGSWQREGSADTTADCVLLYKKTTGSSDTKTVNFEVTLDAVADADGVYNIATGNYINIEQILAQVDGESTDDYTVEWTVVDEDGNTVDSDVFTASNDRLTGLEAGEYTVTATLTKVDGYTPINNATNTAGIPVSFTVNVIDEEVTYDLQNNVIYLPLNGELDMSNVSLKLDYQLSSDLVVKSTGLVFGLAEAVENGELDLSTPTGNDPYIVPVYFNGTDVSALDTTNGYVQIYVGNSIWDYRDTATSYPGYPDAGAVRMDKFATGINFNQTGLAKLELNAAGISTKDAVDVVLVVDVSNSMAWTDNWFNSYDGDDSDAEDPDKIPYNDNGEADASQEDKLDQAMAAASNFADTLLSGYIAGSDKNNTISFVTFAGNDEDYGGNGDDIDSVMTVFTGVEQASQAKLSFQNTKFTDLEVKENDKGNKSVTYTLKIADTEGDKIVEGSNRGNTNYDWAFAEAQRAVTKLKDEYESKNGVSYDESGRELHVVFMTDGAPSHYNGKHYAGGNEGDRYDKFSGSASEWLAHAQKPNTLATELYAEITDMHIVGYDLDHGGFGSYSWTENELGRVLYGIVESNYLPYTLASNTDKLNKFFDDLGKSLSYAGTEATVSDTIGNEFELRTKATDLDGTGTGSEFMETPIQIVSRRLVVASDIGNSLSIYLDGEYQNVTIKEEHLGAYVENGETVIEEITFGSNANTAYSSLLGDEDDIWSGDNTTGTINGRYVTFDFATKTFTWNIGDVTEYEYALTYYAYLTSAQETGDALPTDGLHDTNVEATLTYIDVNGDIAEREYPVPALAWGSGAISVHFYLVNGEGEYANEAGETFENEANRLFLTNTTNYTIDWGGTKVISGSQAFADAKVDSSMYELFDSTVEVTVVQSNAKEGSGTPSSTNNGTTEGGKSIQTLSMSLTEALDLLGDKTYTQVTINIPVIKTGRSMTNTPLTPEVIVLDYGKKIQQSIFNGNETAITSYGYSMEVYGFHTYDPNFSTNWYLELGKGEFSANPLAEGETYTLDGVGVFTIVDKDAGIITFEPTEIMDGVENIFAVVKITKLDNGAATNQNYYLYNPVTIVPATTVYYETDFANGILTNVGSWTNDATDHRTQDADPDVNRREDYKIVKGQIVYENGQPVIIKAHIDDLYGNDSSYDTGHGLSSGSAMLAAGEGPNKTYTTFSFTGTGLDIISRTGVNEGTIRARVYDANGTLVKTVTVINKGATELNQIPVINIRDLAHGTYTVQIGVYAAVDYSDYTYTDANGNTVTVDRDHLDRGNSFYFDAIRVYGTCAAGEDAAIALEEYKLDGEANPEIEEIRDLILTAQEFNDGVTSGIIYIDGSSYSQPTVTDYDLVGPNNELYLLSGNKIAFKLKVAQNVPATVALAAKSVDGNAAGLKVTIVDETSKVVVDNVTINSATAQYYNLLNGVNGSVFTDGATIIIENTGSGKLSLTDLKVAFAGDGSSVEIISDEETEKIVFAVEDASCKIESANFSETEYRIMRTATMTVVTSSNVETLKLTDVNGNVVWSSATCYETGDTKVWTVKMRPLLLGDQTYTVVAFNAEGKQGTNVSNTIKVTN